MSAVQQDAMDDQNARAAYLRAATQIQRWRDFGSHAAAYLAMNALFVLLWAAFGRGFFWPAFPLMGWGVGLSAQHFNVVLRGHVSDADVRRHLDRDQR